MPSPDLATKYREAGAETIEALRDQAERLSAAVRPRVAAGVDRAGDAIVHLKDVTSRKVSRALSDRGGVRRAEKAATAQLPLLLGAASRIARRHPVWLVAGGVSLAAMGYLIWRGRQDDQFEDEAIET